MARSLTADAFDVIGTGATYTTKATITPPGGTATEVVLAPGWSVTEQAPVAGARLGVTSLQLLPTDGIDDLFVAAGYPGAIFNLYIGIVLGTATEWVQVFSGYVVEGTSRRTNLGVVVSLQDGWAFSDKAAFDGQYQSTVGVSRANTVAEIMASVIVGLSTIIDSNGGYLTTSGVYTGSRAQAAAAVAKDGLLQAGFNGNGDLFIRKQHAIDDTLTPVWQFRSDQSDQFSASHLPSGTATIADGTLERTRPWTDSLYNAVIVRPGGSEQEWEAQTSRLTSTDDPRHEDYVGFRPYEIISDTIGNVCDALVLAQYTLTRLLRVSDERVKLTVLLNPAIEADDVFYVAALPTLDDAGWNGTYIATSVTHSPSTGTTAIEGMSAGGYALSNT